MVIVFLLVLIIAILLAFFGILENPGEDSPKEKRGQSLRDVQANFCQEFAKTQNNNPLKIDVSDARSFLK
jgi:Na+/melibiose symporter-like transporter